MGPRCAELTWGMGISLNMLNSLRGRILALVLGLVTLVLAAAVVGIAVTERAETERQVGIQLQVAADTAREVLRFRGSQLTTAVEVLTSDFGFREAVASADGGPASRQHDHGFLGENGPRPGAADRKRRRRRNPAALPAHRRSSLPIG